MKNKKWLIFLILTLLWTGFIFSMSLKVAEDSANMSNGILTVILNPFEKIFGQISDETVDFLRYFIRKLAHFTEFAVLGLLAFLSVSGMPKLKYKGVLAAMYGLIIAMSDETIQLFVDGRAGRLTDVIIDFCGVLTGVIITQIIIKTGRKNGKHN